MDEDRLHRAFMKALLDDVQALEQMIGDGVFVTGSRRVGAEQEMFLIDAAARPAPVALQVLERADDERLTTELAAFNLEANASPREFSGACLRELHAELDELIETSREAARASGADVVLAGVLPTVRKSDLGYANMTPRSRYKMLDEATRRLRGGDFHIYIKGVDELRATHDNVMLEACNTSFQLHFQVAPAEFARLYNLAQAVTGPVLAAAVNSPLFLGKRLWSETRVALFERSVDSRSDTHATRGLEPRVSFGTEWVRESVLEVFREQIARFRVLFPADIEERSLDELRAGRIPKLTALCIHNGTIYRWNRACYGVGEGGPHLRIENRALPAGPTTADEVANAALYYGLLAALSDRYGDITEHMAFADAKENFVSAARYGLRAQMTWLGGETLTAQRLLLDELLPAARQGLARAGVDADDVDRYLGIIEQRVETERTGARWVLESLAGMGDRGTADLRDRAITADLLEHQQRGAPVHEWPLCELGDDAEWRESFRTVGQFMTTDLFTLRRGDLVDLAAAVMDWRHIEHVPVEDDQGRLVGILSHRSLLRLVARGDADGRTEVAVEDVMKPDPITIGPDTPTLEAMRLMREQKVGCLPVTDEGRLVGIVTQTDLIGVSARLLERYLKE